MAILSPESEKVKNGVVKGEIPQSKKAQEPCDCKVFEPLKRKKSSPSTDTNWVMCVVLKAGLEPARPESRGF